MAVALPSLAELGAGAQVVRIPLVTRFRGIDTREAMLLRGPSGWAEWAPFLEYVPLESGRWLAAAVEDAWGPGWPAPVRASVPVNAIIPAVDPVRAATALRESGGCRTAKVKVAEPGQNLDDDLARVAAVRSALDEAGPGGRLRVDANGGWSLAQAQVALRELAVFDLEYAEQPCPTLAEQAELRRRVDVPLAADEGVRKAVDPRRVAGLAEAADLVVLKVAPLGGVSAAMDVARGCGLPVVVSSALDTSVGLAAGVALAAALPELPYACGLGSGRLLLADVVLRRLLPQGGELPVARPEPDPGLLAELAAPAERLRWWHSRLAAAYESMLAS
jgi:o-succinylbenzoate synthase